jgi:Phosphoesterase family
MRLYLALTAAALATVAAAATRAAEPDCRTFEPRKIARKTFATPRASQRGPPWSLPRQFEHALVAVLENQDYEAVMQHPYFQALARRGALLTHFTAPFHPSYPNYLALVGGKYFGTTSDDQRDLPSSERTIADLLEAKGLTWRQYAEGFPGRCDRADSASASRYERKHVPFMSFESITRDPARCARVVPADRFDRKDLPSFAIYSPDMCNDGHDVCGDERSATGPAAHRKLDQAAEWLRAFLEPILADPAVMKDTLVVVTFDESAESANNHIYTVLLGGMIRAGERVDACYDHYNLLRTIEDNFALGTLGAEDERSVPMVGSMWRAWSRPQRGP